MPARFGLDGTMIPRQVRRLFDQRAEARRAADSSSAVLRYRGRDHVVRLQNISSAGVMIVFNQTPHIGEKMTIQLLDRGTMECEVRWVRDGLVGLVLMTGLE